MTFTLYPAIDARDGAVVRLRQGDYARQTRYRFTPYAQASAFAAAGATWLHLVDLDAARAGGYTLAPLVRRIKAGTRLRVQTGGGVRSDADIAAVLDAGADRVVVGSLALRAPERVARWLDRHGAERIVLALDVRADADGRLEAPSHGWTRGTGIDPLARLRRHAAEGLRHALCTDIGRDGMLAGIDPALNRALVAAAPGVAVQCSGGIRDRADIEQARASGCGGAVVGRALLEGAALDGLVRAVAC